MILRELKEKDGILMIEWMQDESINKYFRFNARNSTITDVQEFISKSESDKNNKHFAIVNDSDEYLGTVSLKNIDYIVGSAEYAIVLRHSYQGCGAGRYGTEEILKYGFEKLKLNRVYLNVISNNEHAIKFYKRMGFVYEGEFIQHILINGNRENLQWYRMLRCEYDKRFTKYN